MYLLKLPGNPFMNIYKAAEFITVFWSAIAITPISITPPPFWGGRIDVSTSNVTYRFIDTVIG